MRACLGFVLLALLPGACTVSNPDYSPPGPGAEAGADALGSDGQPGLDGPLGDREPLPDGLACAPGAFIKCKSATQLLKCNAAGTGTETVSCSPYACNAYFQRCNECDPATKPVCDGDAVVDCSSNGLKTITPCPNGCDGGQCVTCVKQTFYKDADGDGFGDPTQEVEDCTQPAGYVENGKDCDDLDQMAYPGQAWFFTQLTAGTQTYDFNCDGTEEKKFTQQVNCYKQGGVCLGDGWSDAVPECGKWAMWSTCTKGISTDCYEAKSYKIQPCR